jgi:hypothetical protein
VNLGEARCAATRELGEAWRRGLLMAGKLAGGDSWLAAGELTGSRERGQRLAAGGNRGMREG